MQQSFPTFLKQATVLYFALLAGQILVLIVLYFAIPRSYTMQGDWLVLLPLLIALPIIGWALSRQRMSTARNAADLAAKANTWRMACIMRWAMTEGATLMGLVLFFFSNGHIALLAVAGVNIIYFTFLRPSRDKFVRDLDLTTTEVLNLDDPNFSITVPTSPYA